MEDKQYGPTIAIFIVIIVIIFGSTVIFKSTYENTFIPEEEDREDEDTPFSMEEDMIIKVEEKIIERKVIE